MTGKPYLGLRFCDANVRVCFGPPRQCSNRAWRQVGKRLLCEKHLRGEAVQITITFEQEKLDGTEAARIALAVKRAISVTSGIAGPIMDEDGVVLGQWKAESTKKRKAI